MIPDPDKPVCSRCGAPLPALAGALCPRCLLRAGLAGLLPGEAVAPDAGDNAPGYRLLEKIGEGGLGEVFLAEQNVPVRREVAVKFLRAELDAADWTRRFAIERDALAQLDHPNIAMIFDAGVSRDGRPFYAMELIDGLPLTHFCRRAKLKAGARLDLFTTVCGAVQHAHQKGVLHGDLKPSNILVALDETGGPVPKLIDFGIARTAWHGRDGSGAESAPWRFGTPGYASPEQSAGARPPDARSDVYSLGVVLRELLDEFPAWLRGEGGWIITRATAPVPENRYESAAALAGDVRCLLEIRPLTSGPKTWIYRAAKFCRRHRRRIALTGLTVIALMSAATVFLRQALRTRRAAEEMEAARRTAVVEMMRSDVMNGLAHGLAQAMRESDAMHRQHMVRTLLENSGRRADEAAAEGHADAALSIRMALGAAAQGLDEPEEAAQHFLAARDLAASQSIPDDPRLRAVEGALTRAYLAARRYDLAEPLLKSLTTNTRSAGGSGPDAWDPLMDLTRLYLETRRFGEAAVPALRAVEITERRFNRLHPIFLEALHLLGRVRIEQKQYEEAHKLLRETVAGMTKQLGSDAPPTRAAAANLAEVEQVLRDMEKLPQK